MTESLLLALMGGAAGLALALAGVSALGGLAPPELPQLGEIRVDLAVLTFATVVVLTRSRALRTE